MSSSLMPPLTPPPTLSRDLLLRPILLAADGVLKPELSDKPKELRLGMPLRGAVMKVKISINGTQSVSKEQLLESLLRPRQRIGTDGPVELRRPAAASVA